MNKRRTAPRTTALSEINAAVKASLLITLCG
jgi:hypothetical protein